MSVLQAYVGVVHRAKSPEDVISHLEMTIEVLRAQVCDLAGSDVVADLKRIYPQIPLMPLQLLALLLRRDIASRDAITAALHGLRSDPADPHTIIVHLSRLRRCLPKGAIHNHWGIGWSLAPEIKADILARLAALNAPSLPRPESELPEEHPHAATGSAGG